MSKAQQLPIMPGDIVQITEKAERWFRALLVVEENLRWGLKAHALVPTRDGVEQAYYRIKHGRYQRVGTCALVEAETARARQQAEQTHRQQTEERG